MGPSALQSRFPSEQKNLLAVGQTDLEQKVFQKSSKFQIIWNEFQKNPNFGEIPKISNKK
jgi:hypothetical protein